MRLESVPKTLKSKTGKIELFALLFPKNDVKKPSARCEKPCRGLILCFREDRKHSCAGSVFLRSVI